MVTQSAAGLAYAVTREDARIEGDLVLRTGAKKVLTVAAGGCVALSLAARFPEVSVVAFDESEAQIDHVTRKAEAARQRDFAALNVEHGSPHGLNQLGELEKVFRMLRSYFIEFIVPEEEFEAFFARTRPLEELDAIVRRWIVSPHFRAAFHACFTDLLLKSSLGELSPRFAEAASHPEYFRRVFISAFQRDAAPENPFLQHVFLGYYRQAAAPYYLRNPTDREVTLIHGSLADVPDLGGFDMVSLSHLFDALADDAAVELADRCKKDMKSGAMLLIRKMNSNRPLRPLLEDSFDFDDVLGRSYVMRDRSLFFNAIEVARKR